MSTFIVSLFLPYTVDFHDLPTPDRRPSPPPRVTSKQDVNDAYGKASLFAQQTPPRTPAPSTEHEEFFSQLQPSAATHFIKPHDPRSLVRSDSHVPDWGSNLFFNQPRSRAQDLPPNTILKYGATQGQEPDRTRARKRTSPGRSRASRSRSKDSHPWGQEWTIEPAVQGNGGLANAVRAAINAGTMEDILWVGTVGFPTDVLEESISTEIEEKLESEYDALAVYVSDSDFDGHYAHYCKTILWPVFHYQIPDHPKSKAYEDHSWKFYVNLNQAFADKIVKSYKRGDKIWIHDYHLLLVPNMIRKKLPDAQIGFFLHTAFPSSEVFRCLSVRKELLEGLLGANLVAFQTPEYTEHFLTTCSRLLIVEATNEGVQLDDHFVNVVSMPIGIDPQGLSLAREEPAVNEWIKIIKERYKGKRIIVARDKLDLVRGVRQKMLAFELFLNKYPEWRDKVVLIQVATASSENAELTATVSDIVTRIDSQHSTLAHQPLVFLRQDIAFSQFLALLSVADALMITSLREGMNLTPHEFVLCQDGKHTSNKHGAVILSEFTGSASVFGDNELSVNPWDYLMCADAIKTALEMGAEERERRYNELRDVVLYNTGEYWTNQLVKTLAKVHQEHYERDSMSIPRLSTNSLAQKYKNAKLRVFILDYEGTLASMSSPNNVHLSSPQRVVDTLNDITMDERNIVYIMSGRRPEALERTFRRVPGIGLIAENGCFVREVGSDEWIALADLDRMKVWKESVKNILEYWHERIERSEIEERHCSLIFRYDKTDDREGAARLAGECANHINDACASQSIHAIPTEKSIIIEPLEWSKGSAAKHIFDNLREARKRQNGAVPDFLMVAGDDREDEVVFRWANKLSQTGTVEAVTTVSVGKRNTEAMATLTQGTSGLLAALQKLANLH